MVVPVTGPTIEFRALGTPVLSSSEAELQSILARPKLLALLSFLAFSAPGFHRRDTLLGLFWAESDQSRARRALRQSLYNLRQSLGPDVLVARGEDELGLDETRLWSDVRAFESALEAGRGEEALELYRGDLLAGFWVAGAPEFERWLDDRRAELRRKASDAARALAQAARAEGNAARAGHWARRATALEPFDERIATEAIELLDSLGDRSGALQLYDVFCRRLEQEYEIEPAPETQALVARIRTRIEVPREVPAAESGGPEVEAVAGTVDSHPRTDPTPAVAQPSATPAPRRIRRPGRRHLVAGLVIGTAAGIALVRFLGTGGSPVLDPGRVVVAVFDNQTGDADLDPLGRMAADWITQALHESGVVEVVPSTMDLAPRTDFTDGGRPDAGELAQATGAATVVTGAYYRRGESFEMQAQVIDPTTGRLLSAPPPVAGPPDSPGVAVDSLSRIVVRTLAVLSEPSLATSAELSRPPSLEAYREYLEGLRNFQHIPLRMREALPYFYRAVALDSAFFTPRFYIIMSHSNLSEYALADSNAQVLATQRLRLSEPQRHMLDWMIARLRGDQMGALEAARARGGADAGVQALYVNRPAEAVELLSVVDLSDHYFQWLALMEAHHMLGSYRRELDEARRGIDAYPGQLRMVDAQLRALAALGRVAEIERIVDAVLLLPDEEPITPGLVMMEAAAELRAHGHRRPASELAARALDWWLSRAGREPGAWSQRFQLALAYYEAERWDEAEALFRELASETPDRLDVRGYLGSLAARRADRAQALEISEGIAGLATWPEFGGDSFRRARIAALLGDRDGAVSLLREAVAAGWPWNIFVHRDADLESLRGYPPYEELIRPKG